MNTPVPFEIEKLLKEKGFPPTYEFDMLVIKQVGNMLSTDGPKREERTPTIAEVVMWLYEKHALHIEILLTYDSPYNTFYYRVMKVGQYFTLSHDGVYRNSPTEAYLEGIKYALNNSID